MSDKMTPERLIDMLAAATKDPGLAQMAADALEEAGHEDDAALVRFAGRVDSTVLYRIAEGADIPHSFLPIAVRPAAWRAVGYRVVSNGLGVLFATAEGYMAGLDRCLMIALSRGHEGLKALGVALDLHREQRR